jgi:hypothetical protein
VPQDGTALVWAALHNIAPVVRLLLERGALVGATDDVRVCQPTRCCVAQAGVLKIEEAREPGGTAAAVLAARLLCGWLGRASPDSAHRLVLRVGYAPVGVRGLGAAF